ncbi:cytokine receptor common subunit beta isoform X3 [Carassius auratus]|uniref:Cytokine receptor common subunit beta isoform X3 n=1 Tax=Carassius auratus TaxID=7957 RepID=A0A6P6JUS1_CARAU|nr:cytokine receptor common subunit beta-like isoform X3 [Carassius auratus]
MFSTWILHVVGFALLVRENISDDQCPRHEVKPGKESAVLDSLACQNDYMSYVQCTWEVDPQVHPQKNTHELYFWDRNEEFNITVETLCVSNVPGVLLPNGKISHVCRYNTERFSLKTNHTLYFKVPCVHRATTLKVAQHGKVWAPTNLTERVTDDGGRLLSWRSPYPVSSNITGTLVYQLQYTSSGHMHDWTTVDNINGSEYMIDKKSLLSGYHYQARVRARGPVGLWSDWSPLVSWKTHNDGPFNLQCMIAGETTVTCTWQMKTEYYQFMSYHLWCSNRSDKLSLCCEYPQLESRKAELSEFMCSVKTPDPYLLTVELRPVYYTRTFLTRNHIKLSQPDQIHVKEGDDVLILNWSEPVVSEDIEYSIQLKISSSKTSNIYNLSKEQNNYELYFTDRDPSTEYQAQIRLLPEPDEDLVVESSEWSQPAVFKFKPVPSSISHVIYILTAVFVGVLFLVSLYNGLPVLHRVKIWKRSIPSPIKSKVLEGMVKKTPGGWPDLQIEKETTSICVLLAADNASLCTSSVSWEPLRLHSEDVKMALSGGSNHLHGYVGESMCSDKSGMNFSGPYILCCEESCTQDKLPDGSMDRHHTCMLEKSESVAPENGDCVVTPPNTMPATRNTDPIDSPTDNPSDKPPAYTPSPDQGCIVLPHPSGYFMMPSVITG